MATRHDERMGIIRRLLERIDGLEEKVRQLQAVEAQRQANHQEWMTLAQELDQKIPSNIHEVIDNSLRRGSDAPTQ